MRNNVSLNFNLNKIEKTYNFEVIFKPEEEERLKTLIRAVWAKIKSFNFGVLLYKIRYQMDSIADYYRH